MPVSRAFSMRLFRTAFDLQSLRIARIQIARLKCAQIFATTKKNRIQNAELPKCMGVFRKTTINPHSFIQLCILVYLHLLN